MRDSVEDLDDIAPFQRPRHPFARETGHSIISTTALLSIVVVCAILYVARDLFLPLVIGMLVAFILTPVVNFLRSRGLSDKTAVIITVLSAASCVAAFLLILLFQLGQIGTKLPQYQGNVLTKVDALLQAGTENRVLSHLQGMVDRISERLEAQQDASVSDQAMKVEVVEQTKLKDIVLDVIVPVLVPVGIFGLIFVMAIFALLERANLRDRLVQLIGGSNILATSRLLAEAGSRVSTYLLSQLLVNVIYAVPIWLGLWLIGVPNALFFGLVTLVLRFVPYVGSAISATLPLLMAFAVSSGWTLVFWTAALFLLVELVTSYVIEPWFYSQRTGLSPFAVITSAMFWTWLWGPLGLVIATPLTVCLVVIGYHVPSLRLFPIMFGDQPVLTEAARLYDRMLAGRTIDFTEAATSSTRQRYLAEYYDRTAIPALSLAQADYEAGLLSDYQMHRISTSAWSLAQELDSVVEEELATAEDGVVEDETSLIANGILDGIGCRVAVVGAQTELDAVAASMLGQAIRAEGAESMVLPLRARLPLALGDFEPTVVIVVTLDETPQNRVGLLVRLIRRRLPQTTAIVARWSADDLERDIAQPRKDPGYPVARGMEEVFAAAFGKPKPESRAASPEVAVGAAPRLA